MDSEQEKLVSMISDLKPETFKNTMEALDAGFKEVIGLLGKVEEESGEIKPEEFLLKIQGALDKAMESLGVSPDMLEALVKNYNKEG